MGRESNNKKNPEARREVSVTVYLTREELAELKETAEAMRLTASSLAGLAISRYLAGKGA